MTRSMKELPERLIRAARARVTPGRSYGRPYFFGATRFSLFQPNSGSWQLTRGGVDEAEYLAKLYAPERMEPRMHVFCDLSVPLLQRMTQERKYRHLVLYSDLMPDAYKQRLKETARRYPVLWLHESGGEPESLNTLIRTRLRRSEATRKAMVYLFRVDDDDLLSVDFLDQVERFMIPEHHGYAVSLTRGYCGIYQDGRYRYVGTHRRPLSSMGQGAIGTWNPGEQRLHLTQVVNHTRTDWKRTVLFDGQQLSFLRTAHVGQDTATAGGDDESAESFLAREQAKYAPVGDVAELFRAFPTLTGVVDDPILES